MTEFNKVVDGVIAYAEAEIIPTLEGWRMGVGYGALLVIRRRAEALLPVLLSDKFISAMGLIDGEGNVDTDTLIEAIKEGVRKSGGKLEIDIPMLGVYKFEEKDFETLHEYIADK